jgi:hypothetical protein
MAVEIQILSGARQGERLDVAADTFQAGDALGCDVFFDSQKDPGARNRLASFRLKEDGWYLASSGGGELMVNERPVIGVARVRNGDVIRLSDRGPDFSFNIIVGRPSHAAVYTPPQSPTFAPVLPLQPVATAVCATPAVPCEGVALPTSQPQATAVPAPSAAAPAQFTQSVILAIAGVAICCLVLLVGLVAIMAMNRAPAAGQPVAPLVATAAPQPKPPPKHVPEVPPVDPEPVQPSPSAESPSDGKNITDPVFKPLRGSVYLLTVENPKQKKTWPFATACAIRPDTLLTCANAAVELVKFQALGLKCWANNSATLTKVEVRDIHVHALFQKFAQDLNKRMYFDFALLTVEGKLPQTAPLASLDELGELEGRSAVVSLSIPHQGELMDRFQSFSPVLTRAKVFIITSLPPAPGPRLLHVKAQMPANIYGSPVFNQEGKLVGVYSDVAVPPPGQPAIANLNLHFVPVVSPELIGSWFAGSGKDIWVPVTIPKTASPSKNTP